MSRTKKKQAKGSARSSAKGAASVKEGSFVDLAFNRATRAAVDVLTLGRSALVKTSVFFARGARKLGSLANALESDAAPAHKIA